MGFFSNLLSGVVKSIITPVAIVVDVVDIAQGEEPNNTSNLTESAIEDLKQAVDDLTDGDIL